MNLKFLLAINLAFLPYLGSAFYAYLPPGHKGAKKNIHLGNQISKGFDQGLAKLNIKKRALPATDRFLSRVRREAGRSTSREHGTKKKRINDYKIDSSSDPSGSDSAAIDQDGTDFSYFSEVTLGSNPGETMYFLLDTGSSSTWVMGQGCTSSACKTHSTYGGSDSSSLKTGKDTFSIGYSTGQVSGSIVSDSVNLAGLDVTMSFGVAATTSDDFNHYPMDGILGLSRSSQGQGMDVPTFMQVVQKNTLLKSNMFGINLQRASDDSNDGEITFGSVDDSKFSGDLNYLDAVGDKTDWKIPADDILVDGKSVSVTGKNAIFDTGTSYMFLPPADAKAVFSQISGAEPGDDELWNIPCDTTTSIALVFNKVGYQISPKDYVGPSVGGGLCYSHIIGLSAVDDDTWLLGDTFLKNVYSVYDMDKDRIGIGAKDKTLDPSSSSSSAASSSASPSSSSTGPSSSGATSPSGTSTSKEPGSHTSSSSPKSTSILPLRPGSASEGSSSTSDNDSAMSTTSAIADTTNGDSSSSSSIPSASQDAAATGAANVAKASLTAFVIAILVLVVSAT